MLKGLLKKLCPAQRVCPLLSLAMMAVGCGKKINDAQTTSGHGKDQAPQAPSALLIMELEEAISSVKKYIFPDTGWFEIPDQLEVKAGVGLGREIKVSYDVSSSGEHFVHCYYKSTVDAYELPIDKCEFPDGSPAATKAFISVKRGNSIKLELMNSTSEDNIFEAAFLVDWVND